MKVKILSAKQKELLNHISQSNIGGQIYWSGGTALAECYLKHRLSKDIVLFSFDLIDDITMRIFIKNIKKKLQIRNLQSRKSMNRQYLNLDGLKLELVYFPFNSLARKTRWNTLLVDSLADISTNKILALYQRNDPKDVYDLYFILQKTDFTIERLIKNIQIKFGEKIDKSLLIAKIQKNIEKLDILSPLVCDKDVFRQMRGYFTQKNKKYLFSILV